MTPPGRTCQSLQTRMSSWLSARKRWYAAFDGGSRSRPAGTRAHVVCAARPSGVIRSPLGDRAANPTSTMRTSPPRSPSATTPRSRTSCSSSSTSPSSSSGTAASYSRRDAANDLRLRHGVPGYSSAADGRPGDGERRCSTRRRCAARGACCARPTTCSTLMDTSAEGIVACVADAGATFLAPIFDELTAVVCLSGTPQSHIGIVSREYQVPCVMGAVFDGANPPTATPSRSTARATTGVVRRVVVSARRTRSDHADVNRGSATTARSRSRSPMQRTALESALIPVTAYILIACVECYRRYPEMIEAITAVASPEDLGRAGHRFGDADRQRAPLGGPELPAGRSQGARDGRDDRPRRRPASHGDRVRLLGPRRAARTASTTARAKRGMPTAPRRRTANSSPAIASRSAGPSRDDELRASHAAQRAAHVVPLPAVVRHPVGLPGHGPVPTRRRPGRCSCARSTGWVRRTSRGARRSARTCRTATCSARSCSTVSTCA